MDDVWEMHDMCEMYDVYATSAQTVRVACDEDGSSSPELPHRQETGGGRGHRRPQRQRRSPQDLTAPKGPPLVVITPRSATAGPAESREARAHRR